MYILNYVDTNLHGSHSNKELFIENFVVTMLCMILEDLHSRRRKYSVVGSEWWCWVMVRARGGWRQHGS